MKRLLSILFVIAIVCSFGSVSFAQSTSGQQTQSFNTQTLTANGYEDNITVVDDGVFSKEEQQAIANAGIPSVKADEASSWIEKKGFEIVGLLQVFVQPFAIIIFIISALMTAVGAIGNGSLVGKGLVGIGISCIMYAVVLFAPELMDFFLAWVRE